MGQIMFSILFAVVHVVYYLVHSGLEFNCCATTPTVTPPMKNHLTLSQFFSIVKSVRQFILSCNVAIWSLQILIVKCNVFMFVRGRDTASDT